LITAMFTVALLARDIGVASSREVFLGTAKLLKSRPAIFYAQTLLLDVRYYVGLNSCVHYDWPQSYEQSSLKVI